jgi:hypothetical protein
MQVKKLLLVLATVIAAPATFATDLSTSPVAVPLDNQFYMTGSDELTPALAIGLGKFCISGGGTLQTLSDGLAVPVLKGFKCDAGAAATYTAFTGVTGPWIVLKNEGSSLAAINPLRTGANTNQLALNDCTLVPGSTTNYACVGSVAKPTHLGISDVTQKIFAGRGGLLPIVGGNTYTPDIPVGAGQGFGVVVSPALYALMQTDQGTTGRPSISRSAYASIITSTNSLWDVLLPNKTPHASQPLIIARRGTATSLQAVVDIYFLNNPCGAGTPIGGALSSVTGTTAGKAFGALPNQFIFKLEPSSDAVLADASSATAYVIGVVSLTRSQAGKPWNYLSIDGISPGNPGGPEFQRVNTITGKYDFAFESYLFQNTKISIGTAKLRGNIDFLRVALQNDLGVGANLNTSNGIFADPNASTSDFGPETARYSRVGIECAPLQFTF